MNVSRNRVLMAWGCCVFAAGLAAAPAQDLLVKNAHVIPANGPELPCGDVLIRDGRVEKVGANLEAPGVPVLDATGKVVTPGFVMAHTDAGLDPRNRNERIPVTPYISVLDAIDPSNPFFEDGLRDGHLTMAVMAGDRQAIAGMGRVLRPYGITVEDMTVVEDAGMKLSLRPASGNRASWLRTIREALQDAQRSLKKKQDARTEETPLTGDLRLDIEALGVEERQQNLVRLLRKDVPAFIFCETAGDVVRALELMDEFELRGHLVCGPKTWRAASILAERKASVILDADFVVNEEDPETGREEERVLPEIFHKAGIPFAVSTNPGNLGARYLWYQAATLVRFGMSREEALATITTIPAKILGLGDRKGALAPGLEGDLLVFSEDPFSGRGWVDQAVIGGRIVYERSKDPRLTEVQGR